MDSARDLAIALATRFLEGGNYTVASTPMEPGLAAGMMPAAASNELVIASEQSGFAGLAIQSVGYAAHSKSNQRVYIYVTKGSRRAFMGVPSNLEGVDIRVERMGRLTVRPEAANSASPIGNVFERRTRIACGSSCAPSGENYSGTLGALVKDHEGKLFFLSNNHVFAACNHTLIDMPILSPSSADGRPGIRAPQEVCRHSEIVELRSGVPTLVPAITADAAIARVTKPNEVSSWQGNSADGYDTPTKTVPLRPGLRVKKFGRTTGLSLGTVEAVIPSPTPIPYKSRHFNARVWVTDTWTVRADPGDHFALPGDSGSLVVTEDGSMSVGLLFAASLNGLYGHIIAIDHVLSRFGKFSLTGGHGV